MTDKPWDETIKTVLFAIFVALVFRSLVVEPFHIPSGSMKSNLLVGDYLFVSKASYGYSRYSFPLGLNVFDGRVWEDKPQRGDVAVFRLPSAPKVDFIKRVIGLPGDTIQVKHGQLIINGVPVPRKRIGSYNDTELGRNIDQYIETLPNGKVISVLDAVQNARMDNTPVYHVPEGHYFMMGDNRDNSRDSRYLDEVGYVPYENFIGQAEWVIFSTNGGAQWWQIWKWPDTLRKERLFMTIN